jgi:cytochrome b involved in lipid metabolism
MQAQTQTQGSAPAQSAPAQQGDRTAAQVEEEKLAKPEEKKKAGGAKGEYTIEEVKQHNKESDCWVIIDGEVLDVTK